MTPASPTTPPDPDSTPDEAPESTPDAIPDAIPEAVQGSAPGSAPDSGPDAIPGPDPVVAPRPGRAPRTAEADVRAAFARAAFEVTPGPMPLEAVRRAGRTRRRRRTTALSAFSVLTVASAVAAVVALTPVRPSPPPPAPAAVPPTAVRTSAPASRTGADLPPALPPAPSPKRVVAAGERVDAGKGRRIWLTQDGKHWTGPDGYENFRSVVDGNIDLAAPDVSHQSEGNGEGAFHSGLYYGTRTAGRVELKGAGGRVIVATLLELPGRPGWGVWYAHSGPADGDLSPVLYDRAGRPLSSLPPN
ncbi:hypothetical protein ACFV14_10560 [Streptomyces zaomyceticus]|uniref:hypothetical protein n=1 Tax=Streptomyces zaomyceticus TaxID=68286 RepID=UPI0036D10C8B